MTKLADWLLRACKASDLIADVDYVASIGDHLSLKCVARIQKIGGHNGMLIFNRNEDIQHYSQEVLDAGYGYSVLDEPANGESFDLDLYKEMFRDWGWSPLKTRDQDITN